MRMWHPNLSHTPNSELTVTGHICSSAHLHFAYSPEMVITLRSSRSSVQSGIVEGADFHSHSHSHFELPISCTNRPIIIVIVCTNNAADLRHYTPVIYSRPSKPRPMHWLIRPIHWSQRLMRRLLSHADVHFPAGLEQFRLASRCTARNQPAGHPGLSAAAQPKVMKFLWALDLAAAQPKVMKFLYATVTPHRPSVSLLPMGCLFVCTMHILEVSCEVPGNGLWLLSLLYHISPKYLHTGATEFLWVLLLSFVFSFASPCSSVRLSMALLTLS